MITVECIDELADYAGLKAQIAEVTERAMRGELDFAAALSGRVALLAGLDAAMIDRCRAERVRIMPGAKALVRTLRARGARTILVSGGFILSPSPSQTKSGSTAPSPTYCTSRTASSPALSEHRLSTRNASGRSCWARLRNWALRNPSRSPLAMAPTTFP